MEVAINAIGTANPHYKRQQMESAEILSSVLHLDKKEQRLLKSIYKSTGIEYRHSVLSDFCKIPGQFEFYPNDFHAAFPTTSKRMDVYKEHALTLAITAIQNCLSQLKDFTITQITHLITTSCTGMYAPGIDIEIVQHLGLNTSTKRTNINFMGCYAAFNALKVADAICRADANARVLIVCVELCTIHFQIKMNLENLISNAIFADGAAAALVGSDINVKKYLVLDNFHCELIPQTSKEMTWHIADSGFDIVLSTYVPQVIQSGISEFMKILLNKKQISLSDINFFAIHPGGLKILQACEKALGISKEDNRYAYHVLKNYGNMSSPTVLFLLKDILADIEDKDHNKKVFSCAFGPGLTLESMLLRVGHVSASI